MTTSKSIGLSFCPFSLFLFAASAALATVHQRRRRSPHKAELVHFQKKVVFILGGPGAGKGTQCALLVDRKPKWKHLSAGDLLREERQNPHSRFGSLINDCIASGRIVPSHITVSLLQQAMESSECTHFLVDGFPRSQENADVWKKQCSDHSVEFVLLLECPEEVLVGRLLERGETSGRSDDTIDVIRKRFQTYQKETTPILSSFENVYRIASDRPIEDVYQALEGYFSD